MLTIGKVSAIFVMVMMVFLGTNAGDVQTPPQNCSEVIKADLVIVLDGSNSIVDVGWKRALNFTVNLARNANFGFNYLRIALVVFSTDVSFIFYLNSFGDIDSFSQAVLSVTQPKGLTYTDLALDGVRKENILFDEGKGARKNVSKILLLITDGESTVPTKTATAAQALKDTGVTNVCVGVGSVNLAELNTIASDPSLVYSVKSYAAIGDILSKLIKTVCEAPPVPPKTC